MSTLVQAQTAIPKGRTCRALSLPRASEYRIRHPLPARHSVRNVSPRRLSQAKRDEILALLNSERFCDQTPAHIYATLLSEGTYHCSVRTMHRILKDANASADRRRITPKQSYAVPRLEAAAPNDVWTWDITKLPTHKAGVSFCLYVMMDLLSRFVVGWMLAKVERSSLAKKLLTETVKRIGIAPKQLHQDRGAVMTSKVFREAMNDCQIEASYSRPRNSDDNPFSESAFKTLKGQPTYPKSFATFAEARSWCTEYFDWYNNEHQHSGLNFYTPADVYHSLWHTRADVRQRALDAAYAAHPERFVAGRPIAKHPPMIVCINPVPVSDEPQETAPQGANEIMAAPNFDYKANDRADIGAPQVPVSTGVVNARILTMGK
jgi:putative transposase